MAAAERIRDLSPGSRDDSAMAQALIEEVMSGYDVNLTATHMAATTLGFALSNDPLQEYEDRTSLSWSGRYW